jgi:O-antigen/teichoic acid export membrane protein
VVALQKIIQAASGFITAVLVTVFLSPEEQGYYYAIGSLLSGYVLLDLGLSGLLVQISARMFPGLSFRQGGQVVPDGFARTAFLGMVAWSRRWYCKAALMSLILIPIGFMYFSFAKTGSLDISWQWPWVLVVFSVALSLPSYPALSILEGAGRVTEVYLIRLGHYLLGALGAWVLLATGLGLYAPAMAPLSIVIVACGSLYMRYRYMYIEKRERESGFSWCKEVWPIQRKVALSSLANYLFLYSPILIVFYFQDSAKAGQIGLSIVVANLLGSICASWLIAKVPRITDCVAQGRAADSRKLFTVEFRKALLMMFTAYGAVLFVVSCFNEIAPTTRMLPIFELFLLFSVFMVFHGMGMFAVFFRAKGREVLASQSLVFSLLSLIVACGIAKNFGVLGVIGSFLVFYGGSGLLGMWLEWKKS